MLNINGLNTAVERQRLSDWIKKQDQIICCLKETHFKYEDVVITILKSLKLLYQNQIVLSGYQHPSNWAVCIYYSPNIVLVLDQLGQSLEFLPYPMQILLMLFPMKNSSLLSSPFCFAHNFNCAHSRPVLTDLFHESKSSPIITGNYIIDHRMSELSRAIKNFSSIPLILQVRKP